MNVELKSLIERIWSRAYMDPIEEHAKWVTEYMVRDTLEKKILNIHEKLADIKETVQVNPPTIETEVPRILLPSLRYRVWDGMQMVYDVMVGRFGVFYVNPGNKGDGLDEKDIASLTPFNTRYSDDIRVMQWTGLVTADGIELYTGDKFKVDHHVYEVRFSKGGFSGDVWYAGVFVLWTDEVTFFPINQYSMEFGKIVGHVFDNR